MTVYFDAAFFDSTYFDTGPSSTTGGHAKATAAQIKAFRARQEADMQRLRDDNEAILLLLEAD